jgi:hypothetical protein
MDGILASVIGNCKVYRYVWKLWYNEPVEKKKAPNYTAKRIEHSVKSKSKLTKKNTIRAESTDISWDKQKKKWYLGIGVIMLGVLLFNVVIIGTMLHLKKTPAVQKPNEAYWFMLHRKSQKELFYRGVPGDASHSSLLKTFTVKTGIPEERPTPLPQLVGRKYWLVIEKADSFENPETSPYFLTLNIPAPDEEPYGPTPYNECRGEQCSWVLPGAFGLHGIASDSSRLSPENPGSSGCIRHRDEDITYLYNRLNPKIEEIRYYIEDI